MRRHRFHVAIGILLCGLVSAGGLGVAAAAGAPAVGTVDSTPAPARWAWPLAGHRLVLPYEAPAHEYGAGHRGVDLRPTVDDVVRAPAPGVVAFSGTVVDRGVLTIDHEDGHVSTLEPVRNSVPAGTRVGRGDAVARLGFGGHTAPGALHFGVRRDGAYINPLLLLGSVPTAVLLPCC